MKTPKIIKKIGYKWINAQNRELLRLNDELNDRINSLESSLTNRISSEVAKMNAHFVHQNLQFWQLYKKDNETLEEAKIRFFNSLTTTDPFFKLKQRGQLFLLTIFIDICEKYGIKYWVAYGTLLGAYRHNGYIPWDDDTDIAMPIDELKKLEKIISENYKSIEINYIYAPNFGIKLPRFVFRRGGACNIWFIDIYPHIPLSIDADVAEQLYLKHTSILVSKLVPVIKANHLSKNFFYESEIDKKTFEIIDYIYQKENFAYLESLSEKCSSDSPSVFVYSLGYPIGNIKHKKISDVFPLTELTFCDLKVKAPQKYKSILEQRYGDLFSLPDDILSHVHSFGMLNSDELSSMENNLNQLINHFNEIDKK